MLTLCLFLLLATDPQQLVESLYPKNQRLKETRMTDLVHHLAIQEGSRVADVGCGNGEFSVILSHVVGPAGKVWCEDISPRAVAVKRDHSKNITVVKGAGDDPKLPAGALDAVLIVNAYHEMPKYEAMLRHIRESLKPNGRLVILDNRPNRTAQRPRDKQTNNHVLSIDLAAAELTAAGFQIVTRDDAFLDNPDQESAHWLLVGRTSGSAQ
jgi:ubiquinone/menaquinone biosynthesis C-methylase UbiE